MTFLGDGWIKRKKLSAGRPGPIPTRPSTGTTAPRAGTKLTEQEQFCTIRSLAESRPCRDGQSRGGPPEETRPRPPRLRARHPPRGTPSPARLRPPDPRRRRGLRRRLALPAAQAAPVERPRHGPRAPRLGLPRAAPPGAAPRPPPRRRLQRHGGRLFLDPHPARRRGGLRRPRQHARAADRGDPPRPRRPEVRQPRAGEEARRALRGRKPRLHARGAVGPRVPGALPAGQRQLDQGHRPDAVGQPEDREHLPLTAADEDGPGQRRGADPLRHRASPGFLTAGPPSAYTLNFAGVNPKSL